MNSSQRATIDDRSSVTVDVDSYAMQRVGSYDYREPYSPWTGVKTAVAIAAILIMFVLYIIVRSRCNPSCRRVAFVRMCLAVRSWMPLWIVARRHLSDADVTKDHPHCVIAESSEQCLRRVEHELTRVVSDHKSSCSDHNADVDLPVCDNVLSYTLNTDDRLGSVVTT